MTEATYTLTNLDEAAKKLLLTGHRVRVDAIDAYRDAVRRSELNIGGGLFNADVTALVEPAWDLTDIIWAKDAGEDEFQHLFDDAIKSSDLKTIRPRVDKTRDEQRRRVKAKAEVFTPSWVCNLQNNLIDDAALYPGAFNVVAGPASKVWSPTPSPIVFSEDYTWAHYVTENRLEMTCGEAPYLVSRYDTVTGEAIPVRSDRGWERVGLLDRKLRVVTENVTDEEEWVQASLYALRSTYGFEWQGDNLLLARLNLLNTLDDYHRELWGSAFPADTLLDAVEIISWNVWQMDGLKMVVPESCSPACNACASKSRGGHDGSVAVVRFGSTVQAFESLLPGSMMATPAKKSAVKPQKNAVLKPTAPTSSLFG